MHILRKLALLAIGLFVLRLVLGLGLGAYHYYTTATFDEYLQSTPVTDEYVSQQVDLTDAIGQGELWQVGKSAPEDWKNNADVYVAGHKAEFEINHGEDALLKLDLQVEYVLDQANSDHLGFQWSAPTLLPGANTRALILVWIDEAGLALGESTATGGKAKVDVFLFSGGGPSQIYYLNSADRDTAYQESAFGLPLAPPKLEFEGLPSFPFWRMLTGIVNQFGDPPAEGLVLFCKTGFEFCWLKESDGNTSSGGISQPSIASNSEEYSREFNLRVSTSMDRSEGLSSTFKVAQSSTWNGQVW
ncbi:MAG: hypothetical protein HQ519_19630 [Planctomycetes bacterium]|nr:hypothetical protein [Planctomycetota bacterium]